MIEMLQTTTTRTLTVLRRVFSSLRISVKVVLDNGPQFVSCEFAKFAQLNGINHIRISPYNPASNREAERFVRTFEEVMKAGKNDRLTIILFQMLACFLLAYRTTPQLTTSVPP